jgi:hypothetical protein
MDDDKKPETPAVPAVATAKPLAVQVVDVIIDGAAAIAKSVVVDTAERMGRSAAKTKVVKVAASLVEKAEKAVPKRRKKTAKSKKTPVKKAAAKKPAQKRSPAKKPAKKTVRKTTKKSASKRAR